MGVGQPIKLEGGKSLVDILSHLRGAPFDIWRGGGEVRKYISVLQQKFKKKLSDIHHKKKFVFCGGKKKSLQPTKTLAPPPPHISNGASLTPERLNYVTVFSVKAVLPWKLQLRLEIRVQCRLLSIF